jgi:regulation of enolase protein 1 (concanavalin A-like superfamily)
MTTYRLRLLNRLMGDEKRARRSPLSFLTALLLTVAAGSTQVRAGVTLAWDPSPGVVAGYRLYRGGVSQVYTNSVTVGNVTSNTAAGLVPGVTNYFAVTAYDTNGLESDFSNEITYAAPVTNTPPPAIALTAPANGASYAAPATINLTASVTPNGHTVTAVQFYNGATLLGQDAAAPYNFAWSNVSAGTYSLIARLVYDSGRTLSSSAATVTAVSGSGTTHLDFTCADRASLLAGGWDFLARTASGATRDTEQTSGAVPDYNQSAHPGVLRIPADTGDLWKAANNTRNSLFRDLPANWTSIRLMLAFAPTQNYQQASLVAYQDDDNYVVLTREFSTGNLVAFAQEKAGAAALLQSAGVAATNLCLRLDRSSTTETLSAYYSLDGTTWTALGNVTQTLNNPRLGIVAGASPAGYPNADFAWAEITSPQTAPVLTVTPASLALSALQGTNPANRSIGITNGGAGTLNWTAVADGTAPTWLTVNPANGVGNGTLTIAAASASLLPGVYTKNITVTAAGAANSPQTVPVTLTVTSLLPTIALTAPANGASYTSPATINLTATVTANGHTITAVQFYNGATLLGQAAAAPYSFAWSSVSEGSYSLSARAVYDAGTTISSASASVAVSAPPASGPPGNTLPAPWQGKDIGSVSTAGSGNATGGVYTVRGAGTLTGSADTLQFVYQPLSANGEIRAQFASAESATNGLAGVMIRESLTAPSRYAFMGLTGNRAYRWQRRSTTAGSTATATSGTGTPPAAWVRLVRTGNSLAGYKSADGTNWALVNSRSITMATNIYVGLAVASGSSNTVNTATFKNISVVP